MIGAQDAILPYEVRLMSLDVPPAAVHRVIHHHAIGIEQPAQRPDGSLHALDPAARRTWAASLVYAHLKLKGYVK